jgi:hypothetical protein
VLFDKLDGLFEVFDAGCFCAVVGGGDEVVDCKLVVMEEGVEVLLVEDAGALGLRKNEVEEEEEAEPGVEWNPRVVALSGETRTRS